MAAGMKREKSEWGFEEVLRKRPEGVEYEPIELDADTIMIHITFPSTYTDSQIDSMSRWGDRFKKVLPKNAFMLLTVRDIEVNVKRPPIPKEININLTNTIIEGFDGTWLELEEKIAELDQSSDLATVNVLLQGCHIRVTEPQVKKQEPEVQEFVPAGVPAKDPLATSWEETIAKGLTPVLGDVGDDDDPPF